MNPCKEYELVLGQVNALTERRQDVTTAYLAVNTAILAALAFVAQEISLLDWAHQLAIMALLIGGIIATSLWRRLLIQYRTLLGWWYTQLRTLEDRMPQSSKVLTREYDAFYEPSSSRPVISLTRYQVRLTWLFTAIYLFFFIMNVCVLLQHVL